MILYKICECHAISLNIFKSQLAIYNKLILKFQLARVDAILSKEQL